MYYYYFRKERNPLKIAKSPFAVCMIMCTVQWYHCMGIMHFVRFSSLIRTIINLTCFKIFRTIVDRTLSNEWFWRSLAIKQNWISRKNWIEQNLVFDFLTQSSERFWLVGRMFSVVSKHVVVLQTLTLLFHFDLPKLQNTLLKGWLIIYFLSFAHIEQLEKSAMTTQEDKEKIQSLEGNK